MHRMLPLVHLYVVKCEIRTLLLKMLVRCIPNICVNTNVLYMSH